MPPMVLAALLAMAPGLLSKMFGGHPEADLRRRIQAALSAQGGLTDQYYNQNLASPAFTQGQQQIASGANATASNLGASLGARGIGATGTGAILSSLGPSIVAHSQAQLKTAAFQGAQQRAQQEIAARIAALNGTSGPSQTQQLFAGGLSSFGPLFQQWFNSKYPTPAPKVG